MKQNNNNITEYFTVKEAAKILNVKVSTIRKWCREKKIPAIKISRKYYRIPKNDFFNYLNKLKEEGGI